MKALFRGKFVALNTCLKKRKSKIKYLCFQEQIKSKSSKKKKKEKN